MQILREIKFEDSRSAKCSILTQLQAPNSDFMNLSTFCRLEFTKLTKFKARKLAETAISALQESQKLILHKI